MDGAMNDAGPGPTVEPGDACGGRAVHDDVHAFLREADLHLGRAEVLLRDLEGDRSAPVRRLRAAMYVKAMRRLRYLIETHRTLPWNRPAPPAPTVTARTSPRPRWLPPRRGKVPPTEASLTGHDP